MVVVVVVVVGRISGGGVGGAVVANSEALVLACWMRFLVRHQVALERKLQPTFALDWLAAQLLMVPHIHLK